MPRWLQIATFLTLPLSLGGALHLYLWRRLVRDTGLRGRPRRAATALIVALFLSMPVTVVLRRYGTTGAGLLVTWPAMIWLGLSFFIGFGLLAIDLVRLVVRIGRGARRLPTPPADPERRQLIARAAGMAALAAATGTIGYGMRTALADIRVVDVPILLPRLPAALEGFTIVQLTDIHVGQTVGRRFVDELVAAANEARPDLIAVTGDVVDGYVPDLGKAVGALGDLRARHGVFYVTGNHEYYFGVDPWMDFIRSIGLRVLRNERVTVGDGAAAFDLAGIEDWEAHRFGPGHGADLPRALAGRDPARPVVLLAHQPRQVHEAARLGVDLQISGHTHGGQIWPWHYIASAQQGGLLHGRHRIGATELYISRGAGYWGPPVRIGAPPEIARITLRSGQAA